ncbi:MAG: hypothetical protein AAF074_10925 [Pseudomonadota bacterium]
MSSNATRSARRAGLSLSRASRIGASNAGRRTRTSLAMGAVSLFGLALVGITVYAYRFGAEVPVQEAALDASVAPPASEAADEGAEQAAAPAARPEPGTVPSAAPSVAPGGPAVGAPAVASVARPGTGAPRSAARPAAADDDTPSLDAYADNTAMTPGLDALRAPPGAPPPGLALPPSLAPGSGPPIGFTPGEAPGAEAPGAEEETALAAADPGADPVAAPEPSAPACPLTNGKDEQTRFFAFEDAADLGGDDLASAIAFSNAVLACDNAGLRIVGFSSGAKNALDGAIQGLARAKALLDMLEREGVDISRVEAASRMGDAGPAAASGLSGVVLSIDQN